jgi:hypothetical protein
VFDIWPHATDSLKRHDCKEFAVIPEETLHLHFLRYLEEYIEMEGGHLQQSHFKNLFPLYPILINYTISHNSHTFLPTVSY